MFLFITLVTLVIAQIAGVMELVTLFSPLVVFGSTELIKYFLPTIQTKIPGWLVISFLVPALSMLLAWLVPSTEFSFWIQVVYGLGAVFIRELMKQLQDLFGSTP